MSLHPLPNRLWGLKTWTGKAFINCPMSRPLEASETSKSVQNLAINGGWREKSHLWPLFIVKRSLKWVIDLPTPFGGSSNMASCELPEPWSLVRWCGDVPISMTGSHMIWPLKSPLIYSHPGVDRIWIFNNKSSQNWEYSRIFSKLWCHIYFRVMIYIYNYICNTVYIYIYT